MVVARTMGNDHRVEADPSRTALLAALARGGHRLLDPPPWILDDPLALELVGPDWRAVAGSGAGAYSDELRRQIRASLALRSRYAEDRLELGAFRQYVLLGAGLDSFGWRRPDLLGPLRLFEIDHPASQAWKRQRIGDLGLAVSGHQVFAPVDFEVASLQEGLDAAGFDWGQPTLFSWLGVVPYLTLGAVESTLRTIAGCRSGSEVVFEYGVEESRLDGYGREFSRTFSTVASESGEPLQGGWSPEEAEAVVGRCGLGVAEHPGRDELTDRYFSDRSDGLRPWSASRLLAATVP